MTERDAPLSTRADRFDASSNLDASTSGTVHDHVASAPHGPAIGRLFGDFELTRVLGEGSFGTVYLARQISLGRWVALKITPDRGSEARALAHLEHDHIVSVFSETVDADTGLRLLCMQFVPGAALDRIIARLDYGQSEAGSGTFLLAALDDVGDEPIAFDPAALADRTALAEADAAEAACWIGARLAGALAFAHGRGVLHYDVKTANILVNRYGRPMLVDFSLAPDPQRPRQASDSFGGTPNYMAPEHLDAANPDEDATHEATDARSDLFSLGVVLFELLTGKLPYDPKVRGNDFAETLSLKAAQRRQLGAASPAAVRPEIPAVLARTVARCLEPDPSKRYPTADELAEALDGDRHLRRAERRMPVPWPFFGLVLRYPLHAVVLLAFLPHLLGSGVNITYNAVRIVRQMSPLQQAMFADLVMIYNAIIYPCCFVLAMICVRPIYRGLRELKSPTSPDRRIVDVGRQYALALPMRVLWLSLLGWLPGALVFPLVLWLRAGPVDSQLLLHLGFSFAIAGLIALTYSVVGTQYMVIRVLYPQLWADGTAAARLTTSELQPVARRAGWLPLLAGLIPMAGAMLMIGVGPDEQFTRSYRLLVAGTIGLGIAGLALTQTVCTRLTAIVMAYRGSGTGR